MKEKIFNALKAAIVVNGKTSISDATISVYVGLIDSEKITDESQIREAIKAHIPILQAMQANINSVAAEAAKNKELEVKTAKEKADAEAAKKVAEDAAKTGEEVSAWQKAIDALTKNVETIAGTINSFVGEKTHQTLSQKLSETLKEKRVPEWYSADILDGRELKSEDDVNAWTEKISSKWGVRNQELANSGFKETVPPAAGDGETKDSDAVVAMINQGTKQIVEQNKKQN